MTSWSSAAISRSRRRLRARDIRALPACAIVALIIAAAIFGGAILDVSGWFIVPAIAILVILFALYQTAKYMPRKTVAGAESAAKWRAFKRYLADLDQQKVGDNAAGDLREVPARMPWHSAWSGRG